MGKPDTDLLVLCDGEDEITIEVVSDAQKKLELARASLIGRVKRRSEEGLAQKKAEQSSASVSASPPLLGQQAKHT